MTGLLSPQRTPGRVPPLQLSSVRSPSGKRDFIDRLDLGLDEQKQFVTEHIDHILLLLSADDHSGYIAAHELDALGFLLAIGPDMFSRFESKFSDAVPDTIEPVLRQDSRSPSLTSVFYPRDDVAVRNYSRAPLSFDPNLILLFSRSSNGFRTLLPQIPIFMLHSNATL
jgi:hypothetical protein